MFLNRINILCYNLGANDFNFNKLKFWYKKHIDNKLT